jgi:hypothetical protein
MEAFLCMVYFKIIISFSYSVQLYFYLEILLLTKTLMCNHRILLVNSFQFVSGVITNVIWELKWNVFFLQPDQFILSYPPVDFTLKMCPRFISYTTTSSSLFVPPVSLILVIPSSLYACHFIWTFTRILLLS